MKNSAIFKTGFFSIVMSVILSCNNKNTETTTTPEGTDMYDATDANTSGNTDPLTSPGSNIDQNSTDPASSSMPGNDTIRGVDTPNSSGTKSGSSSGVPTGSGTNANQGSSTGKTE